MSRIISNVYYLPPPAPATPELPVPSRASWRGRARRFWLRFRLTASEVRRALVRPGRCYGVEDYAFLAGDGELVARARPRRPATILDFEAGRRRLRPVAQG
jgi:hypothetical protein